MIDVNNENSLEVLENYQDKLVVSIHNVNEEISLYEEDYRPDLEEKLESLKSKLKLVNKKIKDLSYKN